MHRRANFFPMSTVPLWTLLLLVVGLANTFRPAHAADVPWGVPPKCRRTRHDPPPKKWCESPPTIPISLPAYTGLWYAIYISGAATRFQSNFCVTANYTLTPQGTVSVLNCNVRPSARRKRPACVRATATKREPKQVNTGKFFVVFESIPNDALDPGRYNVVAVIGTRQRYSAAVVYQCSEGRGGGLETGFFVLSRSPDKAWLVLLLLKFKLKCAGFDTDVNFEKIDHRRCKYFFDKSGFGISGPPPGTGGGGPPGGRPGGPPGDMPGGPPVRP